MHVALKFLSWLRYRQNHLHGRAASSLWVWQDRHHSGSHSTSFWKHKELFVHCFYWAFLCYLGFCWVSLPVLSMLPLFVPFCSYELLLVSVGKLTSWKIWTAFLFFRVSLLYFLRISWIAYIVFWSFQPNLSTPIPDFNKQLSLFIIECICVGFLSFNKCVLILLNYLL